MVDLIVMKSMMGGLRFGALALGLIALSKEFAIYFDADDAALSWTMDSLLFSAFPTG